MFAKLPGQAGGALDARSDEEVAAAEAALVALIQRAERLERARADRKEVGPSPPSPHPLLLKHFDCRSRRLHAWLQGLQLRGLCMVYRCCC